MYIVTGITFLALLFFFLFGVGPIQAQQMHTHIQVHHEFEVKMERWLLNDPIPPDLLKPGWLHIDADHQNAGRISIHATENTTLLLSLEAPDSLVMDDQNILPFRLEAAYIQDGLTVPGLATPFVDKRASFTLSSRGILIDENYTWLRELQTNVFLYGAVYVDDVEPGVYYGEVVVSLEYL